MLQNDEPQQNISIKQTLTGKEPGLTAPPQHLRHSQQADTKKPPQRTDRMKNGCPGWIRTSDQVINSHLLYH